MLSMAERARVSLNKIYASAHHDLGVVEQGVEALVGGILGRHGAHQLRVHYGQHGNEGGVPPEADFLLGVRVGDDAPEVDLRAGAGGESS